MTFKMPLLAQFPTWSLRPLKVLDFDIENRPLAYWYDDRTTGEITAIAWAWYSDDVIDVRTLAAPPHHESSMERMLMDFKAVYDEADMVTGHYIRSHDLPIINSHMIEFGFPKLGPKLTSDTKHDLAKHAQMSASQMALSNMLEVKAPKPRMTNLRWRDANRLTTDGIDLAIERVTGDVRQHMEMRRAMMREGILREPQLWTP